MDWHYSGGRANVLHLGDDESRQRALDAIRELEGVAILSVDGPSLHRNGVEDPEAMGFVVREVDGQLVLDDPQAVAIALAVNKSNCQNTFAINADRVAHFKHRLAERGMTAKEAVIVLLNVNDPFGSEIAEVLMPGHNWKPYRDRGEVPFAHGLADREWIQAGLSAFDEAAANKLKEMTDGVPVVVVDHYVAEVFTA